MVGQEALNRKLDKLFDEGFPPLLMLIGDSGMGKKTLMAEFTKRHKIPSVMVGKTIKEVKAIALDATKLSRQTFYIIPDVDALHRQTIAVLLKLTEEPPKNAHFILMAKFEEQVPATILSRARVERMQIYSASELRQIGKDYYNGEKKVNLAVELAQTPGDIKKALELDLNKLDNYVNKVVERLEEVQPANAFKSATELAFTERDKGWDVLMFMRMLRLEYTRRMLSDGADNRDIWRKRIRVTSNAIQRIERGNTSKRAIYDEWVLQIRRVKK